MADTLNADDLRFPALCCGFGAAATLLAAAQNLGLLLRAKYGVGTPRRMADRARQAQQAATGLLGTLFVLLSALWAKLSASWAPPLAAQPACQLA